MPTTIVVPLDGSPMAEQALPYAVTLAKRHGGPLLLLSAVDLPVEFNAWAEGAAIMAANEIDALTDARVAYLKQIADTLTGVAVEQRALVGGASGVIGEVVGGLGDAVIVMTSHGRTGFRRLMLGSVASRVLRSVAVPLLLIRAHGPEQPAPEPVGFNHVLVPLDGSAFGEQALQRGIAAFGSDALNLSLVRVVELPIFHTGPLPDPAAPLNYGVLQQYAAATRDEARDYLSKLSERLRADGATVTTEVRDGDVTREIVAAAEEQHVDAIVMASHGRGGFSRLFLGSVAEHVLHEADVPVLVVRPTGATDDK